MSPEASRHDTSTSIITAQQTYEVIRSVGEGGMGQVYMVRDPRTGDPLALKCLQSGMMSETRIAAFKREFSLLSELHHPHVCRVYDFGFSSDRQQYFFTAEFVAGEELYRAMLQAPMDEIEQVIAQILNALEFIHAVGLIHFDVKGSNLLVSRIDGKLRVKLVDFGVTAPVGQAQEIAGTLYYMAPELLAPQPQFDQRVDLYSFGVVCYRLLAGVYPYEVSTLEEAQAWHRQQRVDFGPLRERGVPTHLCQLVERLLAPSPEDRFSSAHAALKFLSLHSPHPHGALPTLERAQLIEGPFVGREGILATLTNAIQRIAQFLQAEESIDQEDHPQAYLIGGARGMGKSRLLKEMKFTAQLEDCATWRVDAEREGQDLAGFVRAFGLAASTEPPTADTASQRLFEAATQRATCYLIDNIDRAGPNVQLAVYNLLGRLYSATLAHTAPPLVVAVTYTPEGSPPKASGTPILELSPLSTAELNGYVTQLVGRDDDVTGFCQAVWSFSQGIPLLMAEAARWYHQDPNTMPSSIEELYRQQFAKLSPAGRAALELLCFSEEPLTLAALHHMQAACDEATLIQLEAAGLVRRHADDERYTPATGALQQAIVQGLTEARRMEIADGLLDWLAADNAPPERAAPYARYASDHARAAQILGAAAQLAAHANEGTRAAQLLDQQAALLAAIDPRHPELLAVKRKIATHFLYQGKFQACEELLHQITAQETAPEIDDLKMLGLVKRAQRKPKEAGVFYERALQAMPKDPSNPTYLFVLNERAQALLEEGATQQAVEIYQQSLEWTRQLPKDKRRQVANNNMGAALARQGKIDEALRFYQEKMSAFQDEGRIVTSILGQMGAIYLHAGRSNEALQAFSDAWERSSKSGDQHNALVLLDNIITLLQKKAAYSEALQYAQQSFRIRAAGAADVDLSRSLMTVATLYLYLGLPDLAARYLMQAMRIARKSRNYQLTGWIHINFGYLYKDLGRMMESLNAFEETIAIGEDHQDEGLIRWGAYGAVDLLVENGEIEEAMPYVQQLTPLMQRETDAEFQTRFDLLMHKIDVLKHPRPSDVTGLALSQLVARCRGAGLNELEWEIEYLIGVYHHKRDEIEAAMEHLRCAYDIIVQMAAGLGEEYRDNFRKQRSRSRVTADLKTVSRLAGVGGHTEPRGDLATAITTQDFGVPSEQREREGEAPRALPVEGATRAPGIDTDTDKHHDRTQARPQAKPPAQPATTTGPQRRPIPFDPSKSLAAYEEEILRAAITHHQGELEAVAQSLNLPLDALIEKMERYGIG